jgi:hypothetical protein
MILKKLYFFLFFLVSLPCFADNEDVILSRADSLYSVNKLNQALLSYKKLYFLEKRYSNRMLLRMAQISERNGNYADALYFLETLYIHQPSRKLSQYMATLAGIHDVGGFTFSDFELLAIYLRHYQERVVLGLIGSGLFLLGMMAYRRFTKKTLIYYPVLFVLFCVVSCVLLNLGAYYKKGIVASANAMMVSGPSAGAPVVSKLGKGNRVTILSQQDIWYHVSFENVNGYINGKNLLIPE